MHTLEEDVAYTESKRHRLDLAVTVPLCDDALKLRLFRKDLDQTTRRGSAEPVDELILSQHNLLSVVQAVAFLVPLKRDRSYDKRWELFAIDCSVFVVVCFIKQQINLRRSDLDVQRFNQALGQGRVSAQ